MYVVISFAILINYVSIIVAMFYKLSNVDVEIDYSLTVKLIKFIFYDV